MKFVLLFVYILTIIPHPELATKLCFSGGEPVYEGIHLLGGSDQCSENETCDSLKHHPHTDCLDVDEKQLLVVTDFSVVLSDVASTFAFESLFATTPFRAPPVVYIDPINLPSRIGLILKSTAVILC